VGRLENYPECGIGCTATSRKAANRPDAWRNFWPNMTQKASPTGCRGCVCGPCRARDSTRAAEWPAVNSDWARIRYTCRDISSAGATVQVPKLRLHGYVSKGLWRQPRIFSTTSQQWEAGSSAQATEQRPCVVFLAEFPRLTAFPVIPEIAQKELTRVTLEAQKMPLIPRRFSRLPSHFIVGQACIGLHDKVV
jgi:hypothetical protein